MDWNLFWEAFGAIGTTIGSLVTAGAVVVAVKQYKQPLKKKIEIILQSAKILAIEGDNRYVVVDIYNRGMRELTICSIYIKTEYGKVFLNSMQALTKYTGILPAVLKPEGAVKLFFERKKFFDIIKELVDAGELKKGKNIILIVEDKTGGEYKYKSKEKI